MKSQKISKILGIVVLFLLVVFSMFISTACTDLSAEGEKNVLKQEIETLKAEKEQLQNDKTELENKLAKNQDVVDTLNMIEIVESILAYSTLVPLEGNEESFPNVAMTEYAGIENWSLNSVDFGATKNDANALNLITSANAFSNDFTTFMYNDYLRTNEKYVYIKQESQVLQLYKVKLEKTDEKLFGSCIMVSEYLGQTIFATGRFCFDLSQGLANAKLTIETMTSMSGLDVFIARNGKPLYNAKFATTSTVYQDYLNDMQSEWNDAEAKNTKETAIEFVEELL